jgi:hypothetical protein
MPVAKSYQKYKTVGEPFAKSGRAYIELETGKVVRWYTDKEYAKLYPDEPIVETNNNQIRTVKEVLGFEKGYITVFKGDTYEHLEYFQQNDNLWYNRPFGWFCPSDRELPTDLPDGITPVQLPWEHISNSDGTVKTETQMRAAVNNLLLDPSPSEYQGSVGERITRTLTLIKDVEVSTQWGLSHIFIFRDADENEYVWATASKSLIVGNTYEVTGTIKAHEFYEKKAVKQTILTRCKIA